MRRAIFILLSGLLLGLLPACGGTPKAYIPVDSQLKPWQAPDLSEYKAEEPAPPPAAKPAPAPAAKPAPAAPAKPDAAQKSPGGGK